MAILLPGCWNTQNPDYYYQSIGWARKEVFIQNDWPEECWLFCDIHSWGLTLWVNETRVGGHEGYLSTYFNVKLRPGRLNSFLLRLDASESDDRLGTRFDINNPGGVFGRMFLETRNKSHINDITVKTRSIGDKAHLDVSVEVIGKASSLKLRVVDKDLEIASKVMRLKQTPGIIEGSISIDQPRLWSPEHPHLYLLEASIESDGTLDQIGLEFGVRTIEVQEKGIYLNEKLQSIRGILTFDEHPDTSRYLPSHIILKDFWIAKNANANAWRHHYPASQEFLDLADRHGFLVIESVPLVWNDNLRNPEIVKQARQQLREMIHRDKNHPCIMGWGLWNEIGIFHDWYQDEEYRRIVRNMTRELLQEAESLDPTRFALFATGLAFDDPCLDLKEAKILGINLYPRVYAPDMWKTGDPLEAEVRKGMEMLSFVKERVPGKPIILTEFGWQTIPGLRDFHYGNWSEDYQARYVEELIPEMIKGGACGLVFACFADCTTRPVMKAPLEGERPGEIGYWGMLDQYRKPKLAFSVVKKLYGKMKQLESNPDDWR